MQCPEPHTLDRVPQRGQQDTGTRAQRGASSVMALPGKDWAHSGHPTSSQSLSGLPEPCKYWWPGVGSGQATQVAGKEGRWTQSSAPAGLTRILCKNKTRELRTNPGYHRPPSAQDSSYCVPVRRARPDPKTLWLGGVKCLGLSPQLPFPALAEGNRDRRWRWAPGSWSHELM